MIYKYQWNMNEDSNRLSSSKNNYFKLNMLHCINESARTKMIINANGAFEVRVGDAVVSSIGVNRATIADLIFYRSSSGSVAVDYLR